MAVARFNREGGILGRKVELIEVDEAGAAGGQQDSVNATIKLLSRGDISIFYQGANSTNAIAVSPTVREYKIPHMAGGSSIGIYEENNPWVWQVRMIDDQQAYMLTKAAIDIVGMKNPAILYITSTFGQGLERQIVAELEKRGITPAGIFSYSESEKQFAPLIAQVMASGCDGLIGIAEFAEAALIEQEMEDRGIPCVGCNNFITVNNMALAGDAALGWYSIADWTTEVDTPESKAFVKEYMETWEREPDMTSAIAYDCFLLMRKAIEIAGSADPVKINEALATIKDFPGVSSKLAVDERRNFGSAQYLVVVEKDPTTGNMVRKIVEKLELK
jgi:branched-chain amino acid transport system substrate-binding protein